MIFYCDYTPNALKTMKKNSLTNDDIQEIFNKGMTDGQNRKSMEKDGYKIGVFYEYDGYSLRYVILSTFRRALKYK